ncbi:MAG: NUDIX hydrolase [Acidobacteriota bacterium]
MSNDQRTRNIAHWDSDEAETLAETRIFRLVRKRAVSPNDPARNGEFVVVESPDWVNVIALTDENRVVLIEQFRHGTEEITVEIPGGTIDPGEEPLAAGLRELREETGYGGGSAELIGAVTPNPAMMDNTCHTVLVRGIELRGKPHLDGLEEIRTRLAPLADVPDMIRDGTITHALVIAAFHFLDLHETS